jgi:hypothetical protein
MPVEWPWKRWARRRRETWEWVEWIADQHRAFEAGEEIRPLWIAWPV